MWIPKHEIPDILVSFIRASLSNRTKLTNLLEEWLAEHPEPDRYIKRKGIILSQIAEKGDVDQTYRLEKENRQMKERMEDLEKDYEKLKKAFETVMPILAEKMEDPGFRRKIYEKKKLELANGIPEEKFKISA
jgi:predicted nuclease with TOPRIM domain